MNLFLLYAGLVGFVLGWAVHFLLYHLRDARQQAQDAERFKRRYRG